MEKVTFESLWEDIKAIRAGRPLIHNITNYVAMNSSANALLALGASPVMAHALEEAAEIASHAGALVINIGTLSEAWVAAMHAALRAAKEAGVPVVLDPVGAGATAYRTETVTKLLESKAVSVIRANASEIRGLSNEAVTHIGVDSVDEVESAQAAAQALSKQYGCVVSVSGRVDLVLEGQTSWRVYNGHPMMCRVTGLGCAASALSAAFLSVNKSALQAAVHALALLGIAGEIGQEHSSGPGSLQVGILDALYEVDEWDLKDRLKVEEGC